jgi:Putative addiction module component
MSTAVAKVVAEALELPASQRAFVAEKLLESLEVDEMPELSSKWQEEVRRRCEEVDRGTVELRDAEAVFARAYVSLK